MVILVLFEQFVEKFCLKFLLLNLSASPNMIHFVRAFLIMCALGVRLIVIEKVQNYEKIVFIKDMFENGRWGDASPTFRLSALITLFLTTKPTSRFGFSMMWGKFCHNCFEITARSLLHLHSLNT